MDADGEDSDDEEKRRLEYENDDPDLRDCEWAHSSDEELMFRLHMFCVIHFFLVMLF